MWTGALLTRVYYLWYNESMEIDPNLTTPREIEASVAVDMDGDVIVPSDDSNYTDATMPEGLMPGIDVEEPLGVDVQDLLIDEGDAEEGVPVEEPPYSEDAPDAGNSSKPDLLNFDPDDRETWSTSFRLMLKRIEGAISKANANKWKYPYLHNRKVDGGYIAEIDYLTDAQKAYLNDILTKRLLAQQAMREMSE